MRFDFFSAGKGGEPADFSKLSAAQIAGLGGITQFFSDRKEITDEQRTQIKGIAAAHGMFATSLLGNPNPETYPNFFQKIRASRDSVNGRWQIDKILYLDTPENAPAALQGISKTVPLGAAKHYLDALEFVANYETALLKSGQAQKITGKGAMAADDSIHWTVAAEAAGQPVDIDGWLRPCAMGRPLIAEPAPYFDKKQTKIMAKTGPSSEKGPGMLDGVFKAFAAPANGQVVSAARAAEMAQEQLARAAQDTVYSKIAAAQNTPVLQELQEKGYMREPKKGDFRIDAKKLEPLLAVDPGFKERYVKTITSVLESAAEAEQGHFNKCSPQGLTQIYNKAAENHDPVSYAKSDRVFTGFLVAAISQIAPLMWYAAFSSVGISTLLFGIVAALTTVHSLSAMVTSISMLTEPRPSESETILQFEKKHKERLREMIPQ